MGAELGRKPGNESGIGDGSYELDRGGLSGAAVRRCRNEMPVPGTEAVPYSPRGPTFTVKGAPPILVLNPLLDRLSFSPGIILKDFLKRQLIAISWFLGVFGEWKAQNWVRYVSFHRRPFKFSDFCFPTASLSLNA